DPGRAARDELEGAGALDDARVGERVAAGRERRAVRDLQRPGIGRETGDRQRAAGDADRSGIVEGAAQRRPQRARIYAGRAGAVDRARVVDLEDRAQVERPPGRDIDRSLVGQHLEDGARAVYRAGPVDVDADSRAEDNAGRVVAGVDEEAVAGAAAVEHDVSRPGHRLRTVEGE